MISSAFKSNKRQPSSTSWNYSGRVGPGRSNSDYKAISVQLQLQLPAGTELGNWSKNFDPKMFLHTKKFSVKKNFAPQKFWLKKFLSKKNWIEKFNQN